LAHLRLLSSEPARLKAIAEITEWTNPGPGAFYDDLGNVSSQPHLVCGLSFAEDPGRMHSPRIDFEEDLVLDEPGEAAGIPRRLSWIDHVESLYDAPLVMHYPDLNRNAHYKVRVVYGGDNPKRKIRLVANETVEIHPYILRAIPFEPVEFPIPQTATQGGALSLKWFGEPGLGGNGRGCQVSEVWLIQERASAAQ
jgi:hypothetical protein